MSETGAKEAADTHAVVLVTGPAGAGRTTALHALEDLGYEIIDNLPLSLLPRLLDGPPVGPLGIGCDPRTRDFSVERMLTVVQALAGDEDVDLTLLYVDCDPAVLVSRYTETRRRHPSSPDGQPMVGIEREVGMLAPLRQRADVLIETTAMTPHDLRNEIARLFASDGAGNLTVTLQSFSFKRGLPAGTDMVMDVRFLRNPHWIPSLRPLDGRNGSVAEHVTGDPNWTPFIRRLEDMMRFLLPAYRAEGKAYFTLAIGCTGGRHRSVATVEALGKCLAEEGWRVSIRHRDLVESFGAASESRVEVGEQ